MAWRHNCYLHATVAPPLGHPVDVLLQPVHVGVLDNVRAGLLYGGPDMLHILHKLVNQTLKY